MDDIGILSPVSAGSYDGVENDDFLSWLLVNADTIDPANASLSTSADDPSSTSKTVSPIPLPLSLDTSQSLLQAPLPSVSPIKHEPLLSGTAGTNGTPDPLQAALGFGAGAASAAAAAAAAVSASAGLAMGAAPAAALGGYMAAAAGTQAAAAAAAAACTPAASMPRTASSSVLLPKPSPQPYMLPGMMGFPGGMPLHMGGMPMFPAMPPHLQAMLANMQQQQQQAGLNGNGGLMLDVSGAAGERMGDGAALHKSASAASMDTVASGKGGRSGGGGGGGGDGAKDGRRRKRMRVDELEGAVRSLAEENERLKLHVANVQDKARAIEKRKQAMEAEIAAKLAGACAAGGGGGADSGDAAEGGGGGSSSEAALVEALSRFKDLYADYGEQRRREVQFHLGQLESLILPTQTTKMSLWTLEQDASFYSNRRKGTLIHILTSELGVSEDQIARIQEHRARIKRLIGELKESLRLVKQLETAVTARHRRIDRRMAELQSVLTPRQTATLIRWVSQNKPALAALLGPGDACESRVSTAAEPPDGSA